MTNESIAETRAPKAKQPYQARQFTEGDDYAGVTVLKILNPDSRLDDRRYWARYACCGRVGEITHRALRQRGINHAQACAECHGRAKAEAGIDPEILDRRAKVRALAMSGAWR